MNLKRNVKTVTAELSEHLKRKTKYKTSQSSGPQESAQLTDYNEYRFSFSELTLAALKGTAVTALFAYIFYRSIIAFIILSPLIFFIIKKEKKKYTEKRKTDLSLQFRELMNSLIASLGAGYSIENAFSRSYQDMIMLFGEKSYISPEISYMLKAIKNNRNIEDLLYDFGERSGVKDIKDFAEIFRIAKRSGGDMPYMIRQTVDIISDKIEVSRKIATVISSKKMEQSVMNVVPFGIVLYIDASSPGFFDSLYHNPFGILIMTIVLVIYIFAYLLAEKITDISL